MSHEITRRGRGRSRKSQELVDAAAEILEEIQPATVRAVCYRLFVRRVIDSMSKANTSRVSRNLVWARENGVIPWEWIVDEAREPEREPSWDDPEDVIENAVRGYRKDYWRTQPHWIEVWSEKGTIRGTLDPVLKEYGVTFRVMHGYTSATVIQSVAEETVRNPKPLTILYVGDWDPSGLHMSAVDLPERLGRYGGMANIRRVALDEIDVTHRDLPSFGAITKAKDPRYQWFMKRYGSQCWELDALPPPELRKRVEEEIESYLDLSAWERAREVEEAEVASMREVMGEWTRTISGLVPKYLGGTSHE